MARQKVFEALVDIEQPGAEFLEIRGQLQAGRVAIHQVAFERLGRALMMRTPLVKTHAVPGLQLFGDAALQPMPAQQGRNVIQQSPLAFGEVFAQALHAHEAGSQGNIVFKEEVPRLVQPGGQISVLEQRDLQRFRVEKTPCVLVQVIGVGGAVWLGIAFAC